MCLLELTHTVRELYTAVHYVSSSSFSTSYIHTHDNCALSRQFTFFLIPIFLDIPFQSCLVLFLLFSYEVVQPTTHHPLIHSNSSYDLSTANPFKSSNLIFSNTF